MKYEDMPLAASPLRRPHRDTLLLRLRDLLQFLSAPGDWGYQSKLGVMTQQLIALEREIQRTPPEEERP